MLLLDKQKLFLNYKRLKKAKMITKELKKVEKLNNFDIESLTIEHPKTVPKLSKLIKTTKHSSQQPNKKSSQFHTEISFYLKKHFC